MTKNTPRIFISLLLMLLCIGILPVSAFASGGDYPDNALPTAESSAADAQETKQIGTVTTNGGNLNVRTGAGLDNTAFTQLPNGTVVDVIGRDGDWVKILLPARVGYVYGSYLTVTDAVDSTASIGGMTGGSDALTPDGNLTLIDDIGTSTKAGKQFITLESKNGNVFYMIIDRDDEGEETVHFLNQVDEADLMALTGEEETPSVCSCTTKCVAGTVNTSCPVCAVNMTECVGKEAKPEVPAEPTEPAAEEPEKKSGVGGILVVLLIVALGGGAAFYIFKQKKAKPQTKGSADLDDYDYGEDEDEYEFEPYEDEPEQDTTEDTDV
ncbi:SH3 domain-containing protein [Agathobaculum butyriciproducens]|uniref:CD1107 family mobile element protein n=1 Tax=Agathobaculum butyriciproducens TaxID=1628085 RepID=UPI000D5FCA29|nr:SH3 domain-containing protein [Agathobaculum butyriciproducens]